MTTLSHSLTSLFSHSKLKSIVISEPPPFGSHIAITWHYLKKWWLLPWFSLQQLKKCSHASFSVTYKDIFCGHGPKVSHDPDYWQHHSQGKLCPRICAPQIWRSDWEPAGSCCLFLHKEPQRSHRSTQGIEKIEAIKWSSQVPSREVQKVLEKTLTNTKSRCWLLSHWSEVVLF